MRDPAIDLPKTWTDPTSSLSPQRTCSFEKEYLGTLCGQIIGGTCRRTRLLFISPEGADMEYAILFTFPVKNNEAEYEALIVGMKMASSVLAKKIRAYSDSQLVAEQYLRKFTTKGASMIKYLKVVKELDKAFEEFSLTKIYRTKNARTDGLIKMSNNIRRGGYSNCSTHDCAYSIHFSLGQSQNGGHNLLLK